MQYITRLIEGDIDVPHVRSLGIAPLDVEGSDRQHLEGSEQPRYGNVLRRIGRCRLDIPIAVDADAVETI